MKWKLLKDFKCPKCELFYLESDALSSVHSCRNEKCDFRISNKKMDEIINSMYKK